MSVLIAKHWWGVLLRGLVGLAVGIALLAWTVPTLKVLFWLIAIFAVLDGLIMVVGGIAVKEAPGAARAALVVAGLVGIGFGVVLVTWPKITTFAVVILIGAWWLVTGLFQLIGAFTEADKGDRVWPFLSGTLSVVAGLILLFDPQIGAEALVFVVAIFAIVIGAMNVVLGFSLRGTDMTVTIDDAGNVTPPQKV